MKLAFSLLTAPVAPAFAGMTYPAYRHLLTLKPAPTLLGEPGSRPVQSLAVGGFSEGAAIALALAALPFEGEQTAELLSLYVAPPWRGRGVGRATLATLAEEVAGRGFPSLNTVFLGSAPGSAAFGRVLAARGWAPPQPRALLVRFTFAETQQFPWLNRYPLREGCEIFPWRELTLAERQQLMDSQEQQGWIPEELVPWRWDAEGFEPITSVGMRSPAGLVGWVINHAIDSRTLRFSCAYIRQDLGRHGRSLPLFSESINRIGATQFTQCSFVTPLRHTAMAAFVRRWIAPWAGSVQETLESTNALVAQPAVTPPGCQARSRTGHSASSLENENPKK